MRARLRAALDTGDPEAAAASVPDELLGRRVLPAVRAAFPVPAA